MAITIPTEAERLRVTEWLKAHKADYEFSQELARAAAENFGLWEEDMGVDGVRDFTPIWLVDAALALYA